MHTVLQIFTPLFLKPTGICALAMPSTKKVSKRFLRSCKNFRSCVPEFLKYQYVGMLERGNQRNVHPSLYNVYICTVNNALAPVICRLYQITAWWILEVFWGKSKKNKVSLVIVQFIDGNK